MRPYAAPGWPASYHPAVIPGETDGSEHPGLDAPETSTAYPRLLERRRWAVGLAVMAAALVIQTIPAIVTGRDGARILSMVIFWALEMPALMAALSIAFEWGTRRRWGSTRMLLMSVSVAAAIGMLFGLLFCFVGMAIPSLSASWRHPISYVRASMFGLVFALFHCGVWALAFVYPYAADDARHRALEAERLRTAAELTRLRSQLEPHFILNTLNAIAGLVTQEPRKARRLLACLGDLLRDVLADAEEMQTLDEEIAWLRRYAEILESRHDGHLAFQWEIEEGARSFLIPRLLLQPLVENAVKHGALQRSREGKVVVRASIVATDGQRPARLVCVVEDNGPGMTATPPRLGAIGLKAVRRRLELKYGQAELRCASSAQGTRWMVDLPPTVRTEKTARQENRGRPA
ncbi:MAG TPA: histidine kinase [Polyangiaceae bacterium]|nr:histidine kinase [Polyangiaceae bacterium]